MAVRLSRIHGQRPHAFYAWTPEEQTDAMAVSRIDHPELWRAPKGSGRRQTFGRGGQ